MRNGVIKRGTDLERAGGCHQGLALPSGDAAGVGLQVLQHTGKNFLLLHLCGCGGCSGSPTELGLTSLPKTLGVWLEIGQKMLGR